MKNIVAYAAMVILIFVIFSCSQAQQVSPVSMQVDSPDITFPGEHTFAVEVTNTSKKGVFLYAEITCGMPPDARDSTPVFRRITGKGVTQPDGALLIAKSSKIAEPGTSTWNIDFDYLYDMPRTVYLSIYQGRDKQAIHRIGPTAVRIQPNITAIRDFKRLLQRVRPRFGPAVEIRAGIKDELESIEKLARSPMDTNKWQEITQRLQKLSANINTLLFTGSDKSRKGYWVSVASSSDNVSRWQLFQGSLRGTMTMSGCRGESESAQIVISAHARAINNIRITISDLKGPSGSIIYPDSISCEALVHPDDSLPTGAVADTLGRFSSLSLPKDALRSIWITVKIPANARPGTYSGTIKILPSDARETTKPIKVRVWDFSLPVKRSSNALLTFDEKALARWFGGNTLSARNNFYRMLLGMGLNPVETGSPYPRPDMEEAAKYSQAGLKFISTGKLMNAAGQPEQEFMDNYVRRARRYLELPVIRSCDFTPIVISDGTEVDTEKTLLGMTRQMMPEIIRIRKTPPAQGLLTYVNTWVPAISDFSTASYPSGTGDVWWSIDNNSCEPYPSINNGSDGMHIRMLSWLMWEYSVRGIIISGSGTGGLNLFYTSKNGQPAPSVRLYRLRDMLDDLQYLHMLKDLSEELAKSNSSKNLKGLSEARKLLSVPSEMVTGLTDYCTEVDIMERHRAKVAEAVESLSRVLSANR